MDYIYIGKIVNTHGLKGELRIISSFERKDLVFIKGMHLYLGRKKEEFIINTYRHHKNFDMVTFEGYNDINDVLRFKNLYVYVNRDSLNLDNDYLDSDLIDFDVYNKDTLIGKVIDIIDYGNNKIVKVKNNDKEILIPYNEQFIKKVELSSKKIIVELIEGMI